MNRDHTGYLKRDSWPTKPVSIWTLPHQHPSGKLLTSHTSKTKRGQSIRSEDIVEFRELQKTEEIISNFGILQKVILTQHSHRNLLNKCVTFHSPMKQEKQSQTQNFIESSVSNLGSVFQHSEFKTQTSLMLRILTNQDMQQLEYDITWRSIKSQVQH